MTNPTRTRAEIQAEIEKLQEEMDAAWPQKGAQAYCKAEVTDNEDDDAEILIDGTGCFTTVPMDSLIPAADLIPRTDHEAALAEAGEGKHLTVKNVPCGLAADVLVDTFLDDRFKYSEYVRPKDGQRYRVTVERVVAKDATTDHDHIGDVNDMIEPADAEPIGWANLYTALGYETGYIYSTSESALKYSKPCHGDETAIPLYRHPAPVAPTDVAPAKITDGDCVEHLVGEFVSEGGVGKRIITHSVDGLECELSINVKGRGGTPAVAPKGVVEELQYACDHLLGESDIGATVAIVKAALSRITELPEPSEWAREAVEIDYPLKNRTPDERLDLAAALLERAKEARDE